MAGSLLLGLDVGEVRIGVALARADVRIAQPLLTLANRPEVFSDISALIREHDVSVLVVGWPRGMQGQETEQTRFVDAFVTGLRRHTDLPVYLQDEALTSQQAETELRSRGKPYDKADVDALAATYILDDYLRSQERPALALPKESSDV